MPVSMNEPVVPLRMPTPQVAYNVGLDLGFGCVKAVSNHQDGRHGDGVVFESLEAPGRELSFDVTPPNRMDNIQIFVDQSLRFVGSLARRECNTEYVMDYDKGRSDSTRILAATAFSLLPLPLASEVHLRVCTGLPVSHFKKLKDELKDALLGRYRTRIVNDDRFINMDRSFVVDSVEVFPQCIGAQFSVAFTPEGKQTELGRDFGKAKVATIDIGFNTLDVTVTDRNMYIDRLSRSFGGLGMSGAYEQMISHLAQTYSLLDVTVPRMQELLTRETIRVPGNALVKTSDVMARGFSAHAETVAKAITSVWGTTERNFMDIIQVAGGPANEFALYLQNALRRPDITLVPRSQMANSLGFLYMLNSKYGVR